MGSVAVTVPPPSPLIGVPRVSGVRGRSGVEWYSRERDENWGIRFGRRGTRNTCFLGGNKAKPRPEVGCGWVGIGRHGLNDETPCGSSRTTQSFVTWALTGYNAPKVTPWPDENDLFVLQTHETFHGRANNGWSCGALQSPAIDFSHRSMGRFEGVLRISWC